METTLLHLEKGSVHKESPGVGQDLSKWHQGYNVNVMLFINHSGREGTGSTSGYIETESFSNIIAECTTVNIRI